MMHWYLVYTKPKQEKLALENLQRQGYQCYLPTFPFEKLCRGLIAVVDMPLFPRYLFARLGNEGATMSWVPIRSTKGVSRLVGFGIEPTLVDNNLIELLRAREVSAHSQPERLFNSGDRVMLKDAPFTGIEGVYQIADGDRRVMVLIEIINKPVAVFVAPGSLRKVG